MIELKTNRNILLLLHHQIDN